MIVTKITAQQRDPNRANIFIDSQYALSLSLDQLLAERLKVGAEISSTDLKRLTKLSEDGKLRAKALEWVLLRPRSSKELNTYLIKKQADESLRQAIITEFMAKGYQDDSVFARWWIENRVRKNKSNIAISSELMQKGISQSVINDLLVKASPQKERLLALIMQKRNVPKYKSDTIKFKKFLASKGFGYSDIDEALGDVIDADDGSF